MASRGDNLIVHDIHDAIQVKRVRPVPDCRTASIAVNGIRQLPDQGTGSDGGVAYRHFCLFWLHIISDHIRDLSADVGLYFFAVNEADHTDQHAVIQRHGLMVMAKHPGRVLHGPGDADDWVLDLLEIVPRLGQKLLGIRLIVERYETVPVPAVPAIVGQGIQITNPLLASRLVGRIPAGPSPNDIRKCQPTPVRRVSATISSVDLYTLATAIQRRFDLAVVIADRQASQIVTKLKYTSSVLGHGAEDVHPASRDSPASQDKIRDKTDVVYLHGFGHGRPHGFIIACRCSGWVDTDLANRETCRCQKTGEVCADGSVSCSNVRDRFIHQLTDGLVNAIDFPNAIRFPELAGGDLEKTVPAIYA